MCSARLPVIVGVTFAAVSTSAVSATFHLMQIQNVVGGVNGDTSIQAIQLRYRNSGQCYLQPARLWVRDANGDNPVQLFDFSDCPAFPTACTADCSAGATVLLTTANFSAVTDVPLAADFTLTNTIPPGYLAAGTLTFESSGGIVYWRLSWGGASYAGPNDGNCANDDSVCPRPGDFGPAWTGPLPSSGVESVVFQGPAAAVSTTNAADYGLSAGGGTFTNNGGVSATITGLPPCPWDCGDVADGTVSTVDFLALLGQWGQVGTSCDFGNDGVNTVDFLDLLGHWGDCP